MRRALICDALTRKVYLCAKMSTEVITTVKCSNCNVVINELLAYVQNKLDVMDEVSLVSICKDAFREEEISAAKNLLFSSVPKKKRQIVRRRQGKNKRELDDIISLLKVTEPDEVPVFVARDLHRLPAISFDHVDVSKLLKDLLLMQREIEHIKNDYATQDQLKKVTLDLAHVQSEMMKENLMSVRGDNVNTRRGACLMDSFCMDSGPVGLQLHQQNINPENLEPVTSPINKGLTSPLYDSLSQHTDASVLVSHEERPRLSTPRNESPSLYALCAPILDRNDSKTGSLLGLGSAERKQTNTMTGNSNDKSSSMQRKTAPQCSFADLVSRDGEWNEPNRDTNWTIVQRNRLRNRFEGKSGIARDEPECRFRAADIKIPLFVNNVSKDASEEDICTYIRKKTNIMVSLYKINMKTRRDYDSYKIFVPQHKLSVFMDASLWPDGIRFRRFINFRHKASECKSPVTSKPNKT